MKRIKLLMMASLIACSVQLPAMAAEYNDDTASSLTGRYDDKDQDAGHGPGAQATSNMEEQSEKESGGPEVHEVTMSETYHEDFKLYEESINSLYFLYSNVSNGGITEEPVYVEIPAGLAYTVEKDGVPISYTSGQKVADKGTYVVRVTAVRDPNVPLSEQEEYRAVFRFRIDHKPRETTAAGLGLPTGTGSTDLLGQTGGQGQTGTQETMTEETTAALDESDALPVQADAGQPESQETEKEESKEAKESKEAEESTEETKPHANSGNQNAISQVYDSSTMKYQVTFPDGFTFLSSVPDGMIINMPVKLEIEDEDGFQLYKGEAEIPYEADQELNEYGEYRLTSGDSEFRFEISNTYVRSDEYHAPRGMKIIEARFQDEVMDSGDGSSVKMEQDGSYTFKLEGDGGDSFTVTLNRDTQAPEVEVRVERQQAVISYLSDDISEITLTKAGGSPQNFSRKEVTEPGKYVLRVVDRAGNETSKAFRLGYHMNFYALAAIILAIAGIVAGVLFMLRKKKKLTVR